MDEIDIHIVSNRSALQGVSSVGEERQMTMLFADIEGYTSFTESSQPYDVVHILNRYYYLMGRVVEKYKGYIMDYFGDGFLAVFGLEETENHALDAVRAGFDMQDELQKLNKYMDALFDKKFAIRIGINTDKVILGTIGIENMRKLAAIGDGVNFASRIQTANKQLGTYFLVSDSTYRAAGSDVRFKNSHDIEVKGESGFYRVHEIEGLTGRPGSIAHKI